VHGLWIGTELSHLELLTLHSFVRFGHRFRLWVYDDLSTPVPTGVELCDANEILPRARIFRLAQNDPELGLGKGSLGPFSDLFRYMLLWEHGGIWVDMDVTCLRRFDFEEPYLFRGHRIGVVGNVMKVPARSALMKRSFEETDAVSDENVAFLTPNRILAKNVALLGLENYIRSDFSNTDQWFGGVAPFVEGFAEIPDHWYCIHWTNEAWRALQGTNGRKPVVDYIADKNRPFAGSTLHELYRRYSLIDARDTSAPPPPVKPAPAAPGLRVRGQPAPVAFNVLAPDLEGARGRTIAETVGALAASKHISRTVSVLARAADEPALAPDTKLTNLGERGAAAWHKRLALDLGAGSVVLAHGIAAPDLERLEKLGLIPIPVVADANANFGKLPTPFLIAESDGVASALRAAGSGKAVITVRPEVRQHFTPESLQKSRRRMRQRLLIDEATLVIGAIGPFRPEAALTRAVRVLAELRKSLKAKLAVLGSFNDATQRERNAYEAAMRLALELDVIADVIVLHDGKDSDGVWGLFDVLLDTGLAGAPPLALREAELSGLPVVAADTGATREFAGPGAVLLDPKAEAGAYVRAIAGLVGQRSRVLAAEPRDAGLGARMLALLAKHGTERPAPGPRSGTLFVISDLHIGGPARSLANLLGGEISGEKNLVCVLGGISAETCRMALADADVPILTMDQTLSMTDRAERILDWAEDFNVRTVCFWNAPPEIKLLVGKILAVRSLKLVDVSPGPMLFDELQAAEDFQRRIAFSARQYIERLDTFVSLYRKGTPEAVLGVRARATKIIPLGVPLPRRFVPLPPPAAMLPAGLDPRLAIGTCCRIVPDKKPEFLFAMMKRLTERVPGASLTIVGGADDPDYLAELQKLLAEQNLSSAIRFVGRQERVEPFLAIFKVFVMVSERQGCPNASLEAMAMKLPVVANPSGGTGEQIRNGVNGYLVSDPETMAKRVASLLKDPKRAKKMGEAGFARVRENFSLVSMREEFGKILAGSTSSESTSRPRAAVRKGRRKT